MAKDIKGFDLLKTFLRKLNVPESDLKKLSKATISSIFGEVKKDENGNVLLEEFAKALANGFGVEVDDSLETQYAEAYNAIKEFAGFDDNAANISATDLSSIPDEEDTGTQQPKGASNADPSDDIEEIPLPVDTQTPDSVPSVAQTTSNISPANITGKETIAELQSKRSDTLTQLQEAQEAKQNNEAVKTQQEIVEAAKKEYDETVKNIKVEDEKIQEEIDKLKADKETNDNAITEQKTTINDLNTNINAKEGEISAKKSEEPQQSQYTKTITKEDGTTEVVPDVEAYNAAHSKWEKELQKLEDELTALQEKLASAEEKLTALEEKAKTIDESLQKILQDESLQKNESVQKANEAQKKFLEEQTKLENLKQTETAQLDANIAQLRQNLSDYDNEINKKRAEELKSGSEEERTKKWNETDFSSYTPEMVAKIASAYGDDFLEDAGKYLSPEQEEAVKQYDSIVSSLVETAADNEEVMKMLTNKMTKAAEEGDERFLNSLLLQGNGKEKKLQGIIDEYNKINDTSFSDVINKSEKLSDELKTKYTEALKKIQEKALAGEQEAETPKNPDYKAPLGWKTDENGVPISDDRGIKVKPTTEDDLKGKYPDFKVEDSKIKDKDGNIVGRTDQNGNYFLYDIPEGWSISKRGNLQDDKGQELRTVDASDKYKIDDKTGKVTTKDGKEVGRAVKNEDGTDSIYINIIEDKTLPDTWQHLADNRYFEEQGLELEESIADYFTGQNALVEGDKLLDKDGNIIGRVIPYKDADGKDQLKFFKYLEPIKSSATPTPSTEPSTEPSADPTGPTGGGPTGGPTGTDPTPSVEPSETPSVEPSETPSDEPVDHQKLWDEAPEEGSKTAEILKEIQQLIKSGKSPEEIMNKIKQMLANSDLSFDEKMQILNTISKDNPEFFKEMTENGENILTDEYADMISQMTAEDSDFTVDDVLAFDKKFREMTGQEDAKFELSTEIPEGETKSQQEKFLDSVVSMFDIATPEQIQKLNESPMFNLESYLPELLEYKDNDGNSLFSHIVGVYNNSEDAKKYYEEAQKYCEEHPELQNEWEQKYVTEEGVDFEKFFDDILNPQDLDTVEKQNAAIYYVLQKGDMEQYFNSRLEESIDDTDSLRALLRILGKELPTSTST